MYEDKFLQYFLKEEKKLSRKWLVEEDDEHKKHKKWIFWKVYIEID